MYRASHHHSAARVVLHDALPSMQISWRFVSLAVVALLRLLGSVLVQGALGASYAVAQAAATVAPQPDLLVLPSDALCVVGERTPQLARTSRVAFEREQRALATVAQPPRALLVLAHGLLGFRPAYARVAQQYQRLVNRR